MPTPGGEPQGPDSRPAQGLWAGVWRRWGRAAFPASEPVQQEASGGADSPEAVRALIDRKRHNDLERRRELDFLRKLRRNEAAAGARPSSAHSMLFPSSLSSSPDERASTLRKIDEIEAQMSVPWHRSGPGSVQPPLVGAPAASDSRSQAGAPATPPQGVSVGAAEAVEVQEFVHDPELEAAALRFAQGDLGGAQDALLALLEPGHPRADAPDTWRVLFDFYRATGQQEHYEDRACDFAARFGTSPPQWRRLSDPTGATDAATGAEPAPSQFPASAQSEARWDWSCPPTLDRSVVSALRSLLAGLPQPWRLSWQDLVRVEPDAFPDLAALVAQWVVQPVRLRFAGADRLEQVIEGALVPGDRQVEAAGWMLRMDLLRAMQRHADFERVALDYCITYEVSPPSWEPARCDLRAAPAGERDAPTETSRPDPCEASGGLSGAVASTEQVSQFVSPAAGELAGALLGDVAPVLARLEARLRGAESVVISCARLERIDFEAAGALLNWTADRRAQGQSVHLKDLHRLVAVFLGAMGLGALARLTLRKD